VQNLVANSLKYTSGAPQRVKIWAERTDGFWLFTVEDNGAGMPPELGDDAFAMFRRAGIDDDASRGIGLAVCRRIIERTAARLSRSPLRRLHRDAVQRAGLMCAPTTCHASPARVHVRV
jgi:light-regulated signal transduction histidine kinase (bacteriophytochrome)